jgi:hypothetical protein
MEHLERFFYLGKPLRNCGTVIGTLRYENKTED